MSVPEAPYGSSAWVAGLLISKLQSANPWFAEAAEAELAWLGNEALPPLRHALETGDGNTRWRVVRVLGRLQHAEIVPLLIQAYQKGPDPLRLTIVQIAGDRDAPEIVPFLCEALRDPCTGVRTAAAQSLACQAPTAGPALRAALPLLRALATGWRSSELAPERRACRMALTQIEAALASDHNLPIPAAAMSSDVRSLPLPAVPEDRVP